MTERIFVLFEDTGEKREVRGLCRVCYPDVLDEEERRGEMLDAPVARETEPVGEYAEALKQPAWASGGLSRGAGANKTISTVRTVRTVRTCEHEDARTAPCVVLDPFMGSGTTALVARTLGRRSVGIELNRDYCDLAANRLAQQSLLAEVIA